jgi:hypothetical protein
MLLRNDNDVLAVAANGTTTPADTKCVTAPLALLENYVMRSVRLTTLQLDGNVVVSHFMHAATHYFIL